MELESGSGSRLDLGDGLFGYFVFPGCFPIRELACSQYKFRENAFAEDVDYFER